VTFDLDRFVHAQDAGAYAQAIAELAAGAKRSHWIWFIFPQLAGLGSSSMAETYSLQGVEEANAYLQHPVLRERLLAAMNAVRSSACAEASADKHSTSLRRLMGSQIDALKLVSSMTLFSEVGRRMKDDEVASAADEILQVAGREGFSACVFTRAHL
jgi:uncharacterized protein (DUF1810 family)